MTFQLNGIPRTSAALGLRRLFGGGVYYLFGPKCGAYSRAALLIGGGGYSSKYGNFVLARDWHGQVTSQLATLFTPMKSRASSPVSIQGVFVLLFLVQAEKRKQ